MEDVIRKEVKVCGGVQVLRDPGPKSFRRAPLSLSSLLSDKL